MISGILAEGENATQLTQSVCISSVMVYLHSPRVFQSLIVLSRLPETIWRLSAEKATLNTSLVWPWKTDSSPSVEVPETEGLIPRSRKCKLPI